MRTECLPGSHPHADRPNWRAAETIDEYLANCREGLEEFSERRAAKLLGMSRVALWRCRRMAEIPKDLFELLLKNRCSGREMAQVAQGLAGADPTAEVERCPHCGEVLRVRGRWRDSTRDIVNAWLQARMKESA